MRAGFIRCAVVLLTAAAGSIFGGVAQAETVDGVTVPRADLTAGTGNQVVDITISAGSPVVGSADQLALSTEDGYAVGITAAGAGGACTSIGSAAWSCEPTGSGWRAGAIQLTISTAKAMSCCGSLPLALQIIGAGTPIDVYGSIFIGAAPPTTAPTPVVTKTKRPQPTSAPSTTRTTQQADQRTSSPSATPKPSASASPSGSATPTGTGSVSSSPDASAAAVSSAASLPAVVDAADARSSSSSTWIFGGVAIAVLLLAAAFMEWRRRVLSRRD